MDTRRDKVHAEILMWLVFVFCIVLPLIGGAVYLFKRYF